MTPDRWQEPARLPEGARDTLPVERGELITIESALRGAFAEYGYLEVRTPLIEFADQMDRALDGGVGRAFRLFDDHGRVLVLRPDLTIPVTRLLASRFRDRTGPVRVSYIGARMRPATSGKADPIEETQAGAELVGLSGPAADAEIIAMLVAALRRLGIADLHVAVGHVGLTRAALDALHVAPEDQDRLQAAALSRDLAGWRAIAHTLPLDDSATRLLAELPTRRGGEDVVTALGRDIPSLVPMCTELCETLRLLGQYGSADSVMVDLGVLRDWAYYSGIVFEISAPGLPRPVGAGGRYDTLGARFGADRPAVGGGVWLDGVHRAVNARSDAPGLRDGVVLVGGLDHELTLAGALRAAGIRVVALPSDSDGEAHAALDGWRWVAIPGPGSVVVIDRSTGTRVESSNVLEVFQSRDS